MTNEKWKRIKVTATAATAITATIATGCWSIPLANRIRGYAAVGREGIFALAVGTLFGLLVYKLLMRIEEKKRAAMDREYAAMVARLEDRMRRSRMYTIEDPARTHRTNFAMYSMTGEER